MKYKSNSLLIMAVVSLAVLTTAIASHAQTPLLPKNPNLKGLQNKAKLAVSVQPSKGTSGTIGTVTASGITPGCTTTRLRIGTGETSYTADKNGKLVSQETLTGFPNTDVAIAVLDYCATGIPTAKTVFDITQTPKTTPRSNLLPQ